MTDELTRFGEYAPSDAVLPVRRGDLITLAVTVGALHIGDAVVLWMERQPYEQKADAELFLFEGGWPTLLTDCAALLANRMGDDHVFVFRLPNACDIWVRVLA